MKRNFLVMAAALLFFISFTAQSKAPLPQSQNAADQSWKIPKDCDSFACSLKLMEPGVVKIILETEDGKDSRTVTVQPVPQKLTQKGKPDEVFQNQALLFLFKNKRITRFVKPCFLRYQPDAVNKNLARWNETIPDALNCTTHLEFRPGRDGVRLYADGLFMFDLPGIDGLRNIRITGGSGAVITGAKTFADRKSTPFFETLDMKYEAHPGAMKDAASSLNPGLQILNGIPVLVSSGDASSDLALVDGLRGMSFSDEEDYYMARTSWERHESTQQWSVPSGFYHEACILFALDPDPEKDRAFSFRLGRFSSEGRGHTGWAYTDVFLPEAGKPMPENIREVGKVRFKDTEIPLYLGIFPIDIGSIVQIPTNDVNAGSSRGRDHMDFDIMGRRRIQGPYYDFSHRPDSSKKSAVNIFGITLRKSGVSLYPEQKEPGNIFFNEEKPETAFRVRAERPGRFTVSWRTLDTTGKTELGKGSKEFTFGKAGEESSIAIDLSQKDLGHYLFEISIAENGKTLYTHPGSFALLGPDTRRASRLESPFGSWYTPAHGGERNPDVYLKIFHKAGIRRLGGGYDEFMRLRIPDLLKKYEKYNVTPNQFSYAPPPDKGKDPEKFDQFMHRRYDSLIQSYPDTKYALIFHESFSDSPVPERFGVKGEATEKDRKFTRIATDMAEWFRKNHPDIRLVFGNSNSSSALTAALMRCGFKKEYLDFIGIETTGQGCIPERIWQDGTQGAFFVQETAKTWGRKVRLTGCFEFSSRPGRLFDNKQIQAAYYMRDALIGLAHGFETLSICALNETDNWYTSTIWGSGGLCGVTPLHYPNPALAAYAAMTRALDRINFNPVSRDTGNLSCYALEFTRKDGGFVYALWVPRGTSEVQLDFPREIQASHIGFLGKTSPLSGKTLHLTASEYPQYLITPVKADTVKHLRTIPAEPPKGWKPEVIIDNLASLRPIHPFGLEENADGQRPGTFEIREVKDPEKGSCLEFELIRSGTVPDIVPEYTSIVFKEPITLAGTPDEIGLWVKGDGSWGKISFEIRDALGNRFWNDAPSIDFAAKSYINFKGWYFMTYPLPGKGIRPHRSQSLISGEWRGTPLPMAYPLKLTGLHVTLRREMLDPAEMRETPGVIRIRELGGISNPEYQPAE